MESGLSCIASLGLHLATRATPVMANVQAVRDIARLGEALDRGAVGVDDTVRIDGVATTVGRHLVAACLPPGARQITDEPWEARRGEQVVAQIIRTLHVEIAGRCVDALETLGRRIAERSGLSLALDDFLPPAELCELTDAARDEAMQHERAYHAGEMTDGERFSRQVDAWDEARVRAQIVARATAPERDPLAACAASQREPIAPEALRAPRGTIRVPFGEYQVLHMTGTLGHGLGMHEFFIRAVEARHNVLDAAARQDIAQAMFAELDAAIGDIEIVVDDCGSAARDVRTCEAAGGVCARCFGLAPEDALWPCVGDPVGARAAAAIARAANQLAMHRYFRIC